MAFVRKLDLIESKFHFCLKELVSVDDSEFHAKLTVQFLHSSSTSQFLFLFCLLKVKWTPLNHGFELVSPTSKELNKYNGLGGFVFLRALVHATSFGSMDCVNLPLHQLRQQPTTRLRRNIGADLHSLLHLTSPIIIDVSIDRNTRNETPRRKEANKVLTTTHRPTILVSKK